MVKCSNCDGTGTVTDSNNEEETCPFCNGTGEQKNPNDDPVVNEERDSGPLTRGLLRLGMDDDIDILLGPLL